MRSYSLLVVLLLVIIAVRCSILNQGDQEKNIRAVVSEFQKSLSTQDPDILKQFNTSQSKSALMAAIRVLENKDSLHVKCHADFDQARILHDTSGIKVFVKALLTADTLGLNKSDTSSIVLYLKPVKGKLTISRLGAEEFYSVYVGVRNEVAQAINHDFDGDELYQSYYEGVKKLQKTYDSVPFAVHYDHHVYFYVVKGSWTGAFEGDYKMGLVDFDGNIIVPVEYHLLGTPGIAFERAIEVRQEGLTGLYGMDGKEMIPAEYDFIMPYDDDKDDNIYAIVKKGEAFGTVSSTRGVLMDNFPQRASDYLRTFKYLTDISYSAGSTALAEVPSPDNVGNGYVMPASYLVANGFSNEVIGQFVSNANMYRGNTVTESFSYNFVESVFHKINALVTVIEEHYLDGRGEFYRHNKVEFKDDQGQSLATSSDELFGDLQFKPIDSFVLEVKGAQVNTGSDYDMGGPPNDESEIDIPNYYYFELADGGVPTLMSSSRKFPFTEHVKLDESYITGNFTYFDRAKGDWSTRTELRDSTLMEMRDEILASNGYIFPDEATNSHFGFFKWYSPKTSDLNEVKGSLSDIETYNFKFLEDRLGGSKPDS